MKKRRTNTQPRIEYDGKTIVVLGIISVTLIAILAILARVYRYEFFILYGEALSIVIGILFVVVLNAIGKKEPPTKSGKPVTAVDAADEHHPAGEQAKNRD